MSGRRAWTLPIVLAVVGGIVALATAAAGWSRVVVSRDVGGVAVSEATATAGTTLAPLVVPLGLAAFVLGCLLAVVRGAARRLLAAVVAVAGALLAGTAVEGSLRAAAGDATPTAAPFVALAGAVAVLAGGALGLAGPARPPARTPYTIDAAERAADDEWELASDEDRDDGRA